MTTKILDRLPAACECGHPLDWAVPRKSKGVLVYNCAYCRKEYILREEKR